MNATPQIWQNYTNKSISIAYLYGICKIKQHTLEERHFMKIRLEAKKKKQKHAFYGIAVSHFNNCICKCPKFLGGKHICEHKDRLSQKVILIILARGKKAVKWWHRLPIYVDFYLICICNCYFHSNIDSWILRSGSPMTHMLFSYSVFACSISTLDN